MPTAYDIPTIPGPDAPRWEQDEPDDGDAPRSDPPPDEPEEPQESDPEPEKD